MTEPPDDFLVASNSPIEIRIVPNWRGTPEERWQAAEALDERGPGRGPPTIDDLLGVLRLTWERIPADLEEVSWESPTAPSGEQVLQEVEWLCQLVEGLLDCYGHKEKEHKEKEHG